MDVASQSQHRTRMFARILGPFLTIVAILAAARASHMKTLLSEFTDSAVWPWVAGAFILLGGISIIAFHQVWRGAAAIVISVFGWVLLVRGIFLMAFPDTFASMAGRMIGAGGIWLAVYAVLALIGLYLTYVGWRPEREEVRDRNHA